MTMNEFETPWFKFILLSVSVLLVAVHAMALRYTRTTSSDMYLSTTAVFMAEAVKLMLSIGMLAIETRSTSRLKDSVVQHVFRSPKQLLKLTIPSVLYAVLNNMTIVALSNLSVGVFQVTYQLRILVSALCTVFMLSRPLSRTQWFSIFMLCVGVALTQWNPAQDTTVHTDQNPFYGFVAVAIASLCSGVSGVYFEKVMKSSDTSLWVRNIQMYLSAIVITLAGVFMKDGEKVLSKGFFFGYTPWVWFVIFLSGSKGLYLSVVVKYTDNNVKNFTSVAAILLTTAASAYLFGLEITSTFIFGALLVCVSTCLYGLTKKDTSMLKEQEQQRITDV